VSYQGIVWSLSNLVDDERLMIVLIFRENMPIEMEDIDVPEMF